MAKKTITETTTVDNSPEAIAASGRAAAHTEGLPTVQGLKQQTEEERFSAVRAEARENHAAEHADDGESYESVINRNKVDEN